MNGPTENAGGRERGAPRRWRGLLGETRAEIAASVAALTLLALAVWLKNSGRRAGFVLLPLAMMLVMSLWSLVLLVKPFLTGAAGFDSLLAAVFGLVLLVLSFFLLVETGRALRRRQG